MLDDVGLIVNVVCFVVLILIFQNLFSGLRILFIYFGIKYLNLDLFCLIFFYLKYVNYQFNYYIDILILFQINVMVNKAVGKGYENDNYYIDIKFQFLGIENIYVMRVSFQKLLDGTFFFVY